MGITAALAVIGNEILSGKTQDENAVFLIKELRELGVPIRRIVMVADDVGEIAWAVNAARAAADVVFTTGGIGPTHDDVTIDGIAAAFGRPVVRHPKLDAMIRGHLEGRGTPAELESALKMADVVEGTELLWPEGLTYPVTRIENVYVFPGIPAILKKKWHAIRETFRQAPWELALVYVIPEEHVIARKLSLVQERFPGIEIGSYPDIAAADFKVKVTLESKDAARLKDALAHLLALLDPAQVRRTVTPGGWS
ncbi:MAG: molybdopterin-binding protein [Acidobacteriota bacterium]